MRITKDKVNIMQMNKRRYFLSNRFLNLKKSVYEQSAEDANRDDRSCKYKKPKCSSAFKKIVLLATL